MLITVNGLVTRSYPSGDHDRVIHLITEDRGRLSVMVKGGNSKRGSHSAACTQLFTYGNYELYSGDGDLYWYRGGSVLNSFYNLTAELSRMALATYLCDVASELTAKDMVGEETSALLRMLLNSLYSLNKGAHSPSIVKGVFELRAAAGMGYQPNLVGCSDCGQGYPEEAYFDILNGCFICGECQTRRNRRAGFDHSLEELGERSVICPISSSVLAAMRYALTAPDAKIFSFSLSDPEEERSFAHAAESFLLHNLERDFETLAFYRSVVK